MSDSPRTDRNLARLVRRLDTRARVVEVVTAAPIVASITMGASIVVLALLVALGPEALNAGAVAPWFVSPWRLVAGVNGIGAAAVLVRAALRTRDPVRLLADADRTLGLHSLLVAGFEFSRVAGDPAHSGDLHSRLARLTVARASRASVDVAPRVVYPIALTRRFAVAAVVAVALLAVGLVSARDAERDRSAMIAYGSLLEERGERLAERAESDALADLAAEMEALGRDLQAGLVTPREAQERMAELDRGVEEQLRNLSRARMSAEERETLSSSAEEEIRAALEAGMDGSEVIDFFARMRADGTLMPDEIRALEDAIEELTPDTTLGLTDDVRRLLDRLNPRAAADAASELLDDVIEELVENRRIIEQTGAGIAELVEGFDEEIGRAPGAGGGDRSPLEQEHSPPAPESADAPGGAQGGDAAVADSFGGSFARPDRGAPVLRRIPGIVTEGSVMDLVFRELSPDAVAALPESDRTAAYERAVESAMTRDEWPEELEGIVRDYFLRLSTGEEEADE